MRKILFLLFLSVSFTSFSQDSRYDDAFRANMPAGLGEPIHLPKLDGISHFDIDKIAPYDAKIRILVVNSDSFYHKIFSNYSITKESLADYKGTKDDWQYKTMLSHLNDSLAFIDLLNMNWFYIQPVHNAWRIAITTKAIHPATVMYVCSPMPGS